MKAVLEIGINDLNIHLVEVLESLFQQDVTEVLIRKSTIQLEEFDKTLKFQDVMKSLKDSGYNELLLNDIENGLKLSTIYSKQ
jgi:hypothetical protein